MDELDWERGGEIEQRERIGFHPVKMMG